MTRRRISPHLFPAALAALCLAAGQALAAAQAPMTPPQAPEQRMVESNPHGPTVGECGICHSSRGWVPVVVSDRFDHARFGFRLEGAHGRTPCRGCHASLKFSENKPKTECVECHQDVHQGELGPACERCHTPRNFIDRNRMARGHEATRFPLTGAHRVADCDSCHPRAPQGQLTYVNVPTACVSCHLIQYQGTTDPFHEVVGFSTDCAQCHTPVSWSTGRYLQHDAFFFPIYSGTHRGKWSSCFDCHTNPLNHAEFSCLVGCHAHADPQVMAGKHDGVSGFVYDSNYCYGCHPDGRKP